jgi:hypothetical protein
MTCTFLRLTYGIIVGMYGLTFYSRSGFFNELCSSIFSLLWQPRRTEAILNQEELGKVRDLGNFCAGTQVLVCLPNQAPGPEFKLQYQVWQSDSSSRVLSSKYEALISKPSTTTRKQKTKTIMTSWVQWLRPVILAIWEAENGQITV